METGVYKFDVKKGKKFSIYIQSNDYDSTNPKTPSNRQSKNTKTL